MNDLTIGNLVVSRVVEDPRALFEPANFFPDSTEAAIAEARGWMGERFFDAKSGCFVLAVQSYVVRAGGRTILIDACVGNHKQGRRRESWNGGNWPWLENHFRRALGCASASWPSAVPSRSTRQARIARLRAPRRVSGLPHCR